MMTIDGKNYSGHCGCGREHKMDTSLAVIQPGCLGGFDDFMAQAGISGKRAALYDENTYEAKGLTRPSAQSEIILPPGNLHADELATAKVLAQLDADVDVLIAVGSGTLHDIARYCAEKRGITFVSCPTAASVDGFCSTVSAMTWKGFKKTLPGVAPAIVLADTEVIRQAPLNLALSGVGDILGKYTALLDWNIAHALTGEFICRKIEDMMRQAVGAVHSSCRRVAQRDSEAFEQLTYALLLSGLAMQMMGNSRPASGAEHHISHYIEMEPDTLRLHSSALHGEKVGVGTAIASGVYHDLAAIEDIRPYLRDYRTASAEFLKEAFGERLLSSVLEENQNDCLSGVEAGMLEQHWPEIRRMINDLPTREELETLYQEIGAKRTLEDLGVDSRLIPKLIENSPFVRNRLTFMRARRMIAFEGGK